MIGRDLFNIPCRICRRPTIHRTRTRHSERKSKSEGHCGSYRAGRERRNSQETTSTQALLPTSTHSNGFCIIRVCISSSSSALHVPNFIKEPTLILNYIAALQIAHLIRYNESRPAPLHQSHYAYPCLPLSLFGRKTGRE